MVLELQLNGNRTVFLFLIDVVRSLLILRRLMAMMQEIIIEGKETDVPFFQFQISDPDLRCSCSNKITRICINVECNKQALICDQKNCQSCGQKQHIFCASVQFTSLTYLLEQRTGRQKAFYHRACEIQRNLQKLIRESVQKITQLYAIGQLNQKYRKLIKQIYVEHNPNCMISPEAEDLWQKLQCQRQKSQEQGQILLQNFNSSMKSFAQIVLEPINKSLNLCREVGFSSPNQFKLKSEVICSSLIQESRTASIESNCLLVEEQIKFLLHSLSNPKEFVLLYRGSRDGFTAAQFHKKCDNTPNTLVLVRTEYRKTVGGFTQMPWNAVANNYVHGSNKRCFLISLDLREKMMPNESSYLIYCHPNYGPTFGKYSHDLSIADQCNNNRNSYANFPHCYNREGSDFKYKNQQSTAQKFIGASSGSYFRVVDYEVFKVVY